MTVETHVYVTLNELCHPVRVYRTKEAAENAVESDEYSHEDEVDYYPDVPLIAEESDESR